LHPAKPLRVFAQLRGNVWTHDCDDFARVVIDFDNGAAGLVEINTTTMRPLPRWHVDGMAGSADSPFSVSFDTRVWATIEFTSVQGEGKQLLPRAAPGLSERDMWESFGRAVSGGAFPAVTAESVLPTM